MDIPEDTAATDVGLGLTQDVINEINKSKVSNPGMFVSAWQEDEVGFEKDQDDPIEELLTAAEEGKLDIVRHIYEDNSKTIDFCDKDGYTALHRASYNNHLDVVDFLLRNGANAEARTEDGWTPLLSAANWANYEVVARLISHGVNVNAVSKGNVSALHLAISSNAEEEQNIFTTVRYLLEAPGIDANIKSNSGDTPIMMARRSSGTIYNLLKEHLER